MVHDPSPSRSYRLGWMDPVEYAYESRPGLDEQLIRDIAERKRESPEVLERRLLNLGALDSALTPPDLSEAA